MAVNPRALEGASKGSRYIPERLVGPGVIEQNCYIDQAKSRLHTGQVVPVPSSDGPTIPLATGTPILEAVELNAAVPGTILRFVPSGQTTATTGTETIPVTTTSAIGASFVFRSNNSIDTTTDPVADALGNVGFNINYNSLQEPFYVVVPPGANHVRLFQNPPLIGVEVILDN